MVWKGTVDLIGVPTWKCVASYGVVSPIRVRVERYHTINMNRKSTVLDSVTPMQNVDCIMSRHRSGTMRRHDPGRLWEP